MLKVSQHFVRGNQPETFAKVVVDCMSKVLLRTLNLKPVSPNAMNLLQVFDLSLLVIGLFLDKQSIVILVLLLMTFFVRLQCYASEADLVIARAVLL